MDILKGLLKLTLVIATLAIVAIGIYLGYQYAFPPTQKTASVNIPKLDLTQCSSTNGGSGFDPTDLYYAFQLQQAGDKLTTPAGTNNTEQTFTVESGEPHWVRSNFGIFNVAVFWFGGNAY